MSESCLEPEKSAAFRAVVLVLLVISLFGIVFNSLCLCVLLRKRLQSMSCRTFLLCLTAFDLLLLTRSVLNGLNNLQIISLNLACSRWSDRSMFFLAWIADAGTKYFTLAISVERCIAICWPFRARQVITKRNLTLASVSLATFGLLILPGISFYLFYGEVMTPNGLQLWKAIVLNFLPFGVLLILNFLIYQKILKSRRMSISTKLTKSSDPSSSADRMLLTVVLVFLFCFSFETFRRVLSFLIAFDPFGNKYHFVVQALSDVFYTLNSSVNFIIYYLLGKRFRAEFFSMFGCSKISTKVVAGNGKDGDQSGNVGISSQTKRTDTDVH